MSIKRVEEKVSITPPATDLAEGRADAKSAALHAGMFVAGIVVAIVCLQLALLAGPHEYEGFSEIGWPRAVVAVLMWVVALGGLALGGLEVTLYVWGRISFEKWLRRQRALDEAARKLQPVTEQRTYTTVDLVPSNPTHGLIFLLWYHTRVQLTGEAPSLREAASGPLMLDDGEGAAIALGHVLKDSAQAFADQLQTAGMFDGRGQRRKGRYTGDDLLDAVLAYVAGQRRIGKRRD